MYYTWSEHKRINQPYVNKKVHIYNDSFKVEKLKQQKVDTE